jgi:arylsulfatase A-like enzyme
MDNTLILYVVGDNGASAEGQMNGMFNEMTYFNGVPETVPDMLKHIDEWGGPATYPHMRPVGCCLGCALLLDKTGGFRFWWHAQWHGGALAQWHQS